MKKDFFFLINTKKKSFTEMIKMEKLKLMPQAKFENRVKEPVMIQYLDAEFIEKTLNMLIKSTENLEDKISEIEHRIKNHINTFNDIAHKI